MRSRPLKVLVVGATGSIGQYVVDEAIRQGHGVRALVRSKARAGAILTEKAELAVGDLTKPGTLKSAVEDVDALIFTHGSDGGGKIGAEQVDYGGVRNVLAALAGRSVRIALMTSIGVTNRDGAYNQSTQAHDWKRRGERLVRNSGMPYTIVRPGWFDYNAADQLRLQFLQGDTRHAGDPSDGAVSREQIAEVLVHSLGSPVARGKTIELVAVNGPRSTNLDALFEDARPDAFRALDAILDRTNMPLAEEPAAVLKDYWNLGAR